MHVYVHCVCICVNVHVYISQDCLPKEVRSKESPIVMSTPEARTCSLTSFPTKRKEDILEKWLILASQDISKMNLECDARK